MSNQTDRREYYRKYRQHHKNDEKYKSDMRDRGAKYRLNHPGRDAERVARYRQNNRDKENARNAKYRQDHKNDEAYLTKGRTRVAKYRQRHKDDKVYLENRRATGIRYGRSGKGLEKSRERGKKYRQRHPGLEASRVALRKAIIRGAKSERFTKQEIYERDGGRCHLCGKKCDPRKWHLDHLIPLSLGGEHTRKNVAVSCPRCNDSKGNSGHSQLRLFG